MRSASSLDEDFDGYCKSHDSASDEVVEDQDLGEKDVRKNDREHLTTRRGHDADDGTEFLHDGCDKGESKVGEGSAEDHGDVDCRGRGAELNRLEDVSREQDEDDTVSEAEYVHVVHYLRR